jgi:ATP/maltotriose-dependent transcriptional regulator MalT
VLEALLGEAQSAVEAGDWRTARARFETVLEHGEIPEAWFGLGNVLWWLGETEPSVRALEHAYAAFRRRPDPEQAALAAIYLCLLYRASLGNFAASRGWLARAARVVEESALDPLRGWVLLCRAGAANDEDDPRAAERGARAARDVARESQDGDLDLCALSELGSALVAMGEVARGVALLDEAMAGSLGGESDNPDTVVLASCNTISACSRTGDFNRASQWIQVADDFNRRYGSPHLYTTCRMHYGSILFATGKWEQAEAELSAALKIGAAAEPALHAQALAKFAELRLAQGRFEEAGRLVEGLADRPDTEHAAAAIELAGGCPAVAASIVQRRLRELRGASLEAAALLELLVEAQLAGAGVEDAAPQARELAQLGASLECDAIVARAQRALGRILTGAGSERTAHLELALAAFRRLGMPLEIGRTRLLIAGALADGAPEVAIAEARAALAGFEELGAAHDADMAAAFLRARGVKAARSGPKGLGLLTKRELEVLGLLGEGLSNPQIAERLFLSRKTVEHHVASVLSKLGVAGRGEAGAYAVRHLGAQAGLTGDPALGGRDGR